jgi:hypothetical protein
MLNTLLWQAVVRVAQVLMAQVVALEVYCKDCCQLL